MREFDTVAGPSLTKSFWLKQISVERHLHAPLVSLRVRRGALDGDVRKTEGLKETQTEKLF